ncbi:MAG: lysophospholipid acyltransferase family protein [Candidatus Omnitrophota bacterium]
MLGYFFYDLGKFASFLLIKFCFHLKVCGKENIPKHGGFILASNHISYLDPPAVGVASPRRLNYMARHDLFSIPVLSWLMYQWGAFPVKRDTADISAIKEAMRRVKQGKGLLLFPEGTRQVGGKFGKPEPGIGFLISKINAPVIPVYVRGSDRVLPKGAKFFKPAHIEVYFGKQIDIEKSIPYQDIADKVMYSINQLSIEQNFR